MTDEEQLRRDIETHLENAEERVRKGQRQEAFMEFEEAAGKLEAAENIAQLEQLWAHAATGFSAAEAPRQAGESFLRLAELEVKAGRQEAARESLSDFSRVSFSSICRFTNVAVGPAVEQRREREQAERRDDRSDRNLPEDLAVDPDGFDRRRNSIRSASLNISLPRSRASICGQSPDSKASRAAFAAASTSAESPSAT